MWNPKNYRLGFDLWGLWLFLLIMLSNFVWFVFPAPDDVLRAKSVTPLIDATAQVFQITMAAALCVVINITRDKPMKRGYRAGTEPPVSCCILSDGRLITPRSSAPLYFWTYVWPPAGRFCFGLWRGTTPPL